MLEPSWSYLNEIVRRVYPEVGELDPQPMKGGASTRRFFRIALGAGATSSVATSSVATSAVAMFVPGAPTHEIHKDKGLARWSFLEVHELLQARGIRVPKIIADGTDHGWLVVEDLGDDTVANYLLKHPDEKQSIYQQAVRDLARAQTQLVSLPESSIVKSRAFDRDLLRWEVEHFMEWGILARDVPISDEDRKTFEQVADRLASRIASWPRGFVHRDYQSRNLMVVPSPVGERELAWIDFQDALLGPRVYDLVALLSDSYQEFDAGFIGQRLGEYEDQLRLSPVERAELVREFDFVTVQRKLKDAGRFIFIDRKNGNPSFLPFFELTIQKARAAIGRLSDDADMRTLGALLDRVLGA